MAAASPVSVALPGTEVKKKRGRPRKYGSDGMLTSVALSPMPISSSIPLTGEFTGWKRGKGKSFESLKKHHRYELESPGERIAYYVGANFTAHSITVNAGEDVTLKLLSFSQQGSRAICILSANGVISNVTLCQPSSSGGSLTYEGCFEILSLTGSFMPTEDGGTKSSSGGMSVSFAGPDGRVVGGGLAGLLVAAGPVQVVLGSFLPGHQQEQKQKKQKIERVPIATPVINNPIPREQTEGGQGEQKPNTTFANGDNWASLNSAQGLIDPAADNKKSLPGEESNGPEQPNYHVSS